METLLMETLAASEPIFRRASLPPASGSLAPADGLPDVYALSLPASHFTGDFYHFASRPDGTWFAVGDVTGHGLDSAIFMAMIQELLEERLADPATRSPARAVASIHRQLAPELPVGRFVSLVLGHLAGDGRLRLTNAGHCPPLVLARDRVACVSAHGPILNAYVPPGWTEAGFLLEAGDRVVLYTDGVSEAAAPDGLELGTRGFARAIARCRGRDARSVADAVVEEATRFRAGAPPVDDLTVMVVGRA